MKTENAWALFGRIILAIALLAGAGYLGFRIGLMQNIDLSALQAAASGNLRTSAWMLRPAFGGPGSFLGVVVGILVLGFVIRLFTHALFGFRRPFFHHRMRPWMHHGWQDMPYEWRAWYERAPGEEPPSDSPSEA